MRLRVVSFLGWLAAACRAIAALMPEMADWSEDRLVDCIFCIDYRSSRFNVKGCASGTGQVCRGNVCFMRVHKTDMIELPDRFDLYTAGCMNLTMTQYNMIATRSAGSEWRRRSRTRGGLLCEEQPTATTCICATPDSACNNVNSRSSFSETNSTLFHGLDYREILHFRYFVPAATVLRGLNTRALDDELRSIVPGYTAGASTSYNFLLLIMLAILYLK